VKFSKYGRHRRASRRRLGGKTTPVRVVTLRRAKAKNLRIRDLHDLIKVMNLRISLSRPTRESSQREVNGGFGDLSFPEAMMSIFFGAGIM
jgi:hypothetical protein